LQGNDMTDGFWFGCATAIGDKVTGSVAR
jgi:hypothetical protein